MEQTILQKHIRVLELPKVLERLSKLCHCPDTAEMALNCLPQTNLYEAEKLMAQTVEAYTLVARFGAPSFGGLHNVNGILTRAGAGGTLSMGELLRVGETLRVIRSLKQWQDNHAPSSVALAPFLKMIRLPRASTRISSA
jgi:DNA mismatch repair protein MutS2